MKQSISLTGVAAAPGIYIGNLMILSDELTISRETIRSEQIEETIAAFESALEQVREDTAFLQQKTARELGEAQAAIFETHLMLLEDAMLLDAIRDHIRTELCCAQSSVDVVSERYAAQLLQLDDEYFRERAADIRDIAKRLIGALQNKPKNGLDSASKEVALVAKDLTPSDTARMDKTKVRAFATDLGGRTSHTSIMARTLGIPAVVGVRNLTEHACLGQQIIVDGNSGVVILSPSEEELLLYHKKAEEYQRKMERLTKCSSLPAQTACQKRKVGVCANIGTLADCADALKFGADGVGLYRTEFLFLDRASMPDEEEQFKAYRAIVEKFAPRGVILRSLDVGGDKQIPYMKMPIEQNPFLGWRAIRYCLDRPEFFKVQLRAVLRASAYGKLRLMFPMISSAEQVILAKALLQEAKNELDAKKIPYDRQMPVGVMIEIPAAAITADLIAQQVDFFSIGTNDLIQYTVAADRMNERTVGLYEAYHPAVLRLIANVIDVAHARGLWVGMCGELAGEPLATPLLLGMGLDEFSMSALTVAHVKSVIRSLTFEQAQGVKDCVLSMTSAEQIKNYLEQFRMERLS